MNTAADEFKTALGKKPVFGLSGVSSIRSKHASGSASGSVPNNRHLATRGFVLEDRNRAHLSPFHDEMTDKIDLPLTSPAATRVQTRRQCLLFGIPEADPEGIR